MSISNEFSLGGAGDVGGGGVGELETSRTQQPLAP